MGISAMISCGTISKIKCASSSQGYRTLLVLATTELVVIPAVAEKTLMHVAISEMYHTNNAKVDASRWLKILTSAWRKLLNRIAIQDLSMPVM